MLLESEPKTTERFKSNALLHEAYINNSKILERPYKQEFCFGENTFHPALSNTHSEWTELINKYVDFRVKEHTGYSFDDFINLPLGKIEILLTTLAKISERKNSSEETALAELMNNHQKTD